MCISKVKNYYFLIASQQFLLIDEPIEEILRERIQHYSRLKKYVDFWLVPDPKFLDSPNFKNIAVTYPKNCIAIISTNKVFITWLKLRLTNVFIGEFKAPTLEITSPLSSKLNNQ
ncbi:unnamed protein product [Discosporangium mesarthrocarpum]